MPRVLTADDVSNFRDRLCQVAERLFAEHGAQSVTMRQLAAELGCSPMTPYRYFKDKDAILGAVRAAAFDRFADALEQALHAGVALEPAARSEAVGRAYVHFALTEPHAYRLMFDMTQPNEAAYPDLARASARARATMTEHLQGRALSGDLRDRETVAGYVHWAALHGALMLHLAGKLDPGMDVMVLMRAMLATLGRGVRAEP